MSLINASAVRLDDGFSTTITLENLPGIKLYEKEVTPPGIQGGGATDTTTMRNIAWKTNSPKKLKTLTAIAATVSFASEAIPQVMSQINQLQQITITFPDKASIAIWGWLDQFTPASFAEGTQPTATLSIQPSNHDLEGNEVEPLYTPAADDSDSSNS